MDLWGGRSYVAATMNLLLLLSALLSALTGVAASARAPEVTQAVASSAVAQAEPAVRRLRAARQTASLPALSSVAREPTSARAFPVDAEPLWASRRRE